VITSEEPADWQSLQSMVGGILEECGFDVKIERPTPTVRGVVNIDVFAREERDGRTYTVLCECKQWKSNVPQQVVHAFRTVVHDTGAHVGYVIATKGFQAGALREAELTNVRLVTWQEFQLEFEQAWLTHYMTLTVARELDAFLTLAEPLRPRAYAELSGPQQQRFDEAWATYQPLNAVVMEFSPYLRAFSERPFPSLPLRISKPALNPGLSRAALDATGYRELLYLLIGEGRRATDHLRSLLGKS
jgi:restriction system protein